MKDFFFNLFYRIRYKFYAYFYRRKFRPNSFTFTHLIKNKNTYVTSTVHQFNQSTDIWGNWRVGHGWGVFHPDFPYIYNSEKCVNIAGDKLILDIREIPELHYNGPAGVYNEPKYACGYISLKDPFRLNKGYFEVRCKLPKHKSSWPAFWLTSCDHWPPEVDIFEFYGKRGRGSINRQEIRCIWNEIWREDKSRFRFNIRHNFDLTKSYHVYGCQWNEDGFSFYFDGVKIAQFTNKRVLKKHFDQDFYLIVNNNVHPDHLNSFSPEQDTRFFIDWIRIDQTHERNEEI